MKSRLWTLLLCATVLASGCASWFEPPVVGPDDWVQPMYFGSEATIDWLAENDAQLLRQIVTHNEQLDQLRR
jgi:hypothetical protein